VNAEDDPQGFMQIAGKSGLNAERSKQDQPDGHTLGSSLHPFAVQYPVAWPGISAQ
jgi:hypothetical protein